MENKEKKCPHKFVELGQQENQELQEYFPGLGPNQEFVRIGPKQLFYPKSFLSHLQNINNFPLRNDDTFVVTYPKSGTTLTQELVWLLCNDLDYENALSKVLNERFPFLEATALKLPLELFTENQKEIVLKSMKPQNVAELERLPSPRFIKSHLPLSLLPSSLLVTTKVVYVARDPRDVAVSFYHHHKLLSVISDDGFKSFWNYFITNKIPWGPYFEHVLEAWEHRNDDNMLFLFYEDMIKDLPKAIRRVAEFFGKKLSEDEVNKLGDHLHIDNLKKNKSVNLEEMQKHGLFTAEGAFIRKGKAGGWRKYFDEEMTAQADEWIAKHLRGTDLRFPDF